MRVRLVCVDGRVRRLAVEGRAGPDPSRLLSGVTASTALERLPLLFSVCAAAQTRAAFLALHRAGASGIRRPEGGGDPGWEWVRDHLVRLAVRLPALMNVPARGAQQRVREVLRECQDAAGPAAADTYQAALGVLLDSPMLERPAALHRWLERSRSPVALALRRVRDECPAGMGRCDLTAPGWADWSAGPDPETEEGYPNALVGADGRARETGALPRQRNHPLIAGLRAEEGSTTFVRLVAALVELQQGPRYSAIPPHRVAAADCAAPISGAAQACVETARGLLVHQVVLQEGRVAAYRVLAPTAWNMHPEGPLAGGLCGLPPAAPDQLLHWMRVTILAIDPCWSVDVEVA